MKTKPKLLICTLIFFSGGLLNLFFSAALHDMLSGRMDVLAFPPIADCVTSLVSNRQHLLLYLCIQGFFLILAVLFFTTNLHPYKSDLDEITPDIQTPRAVGQYQHGSARWLTDKEKDQYFSSFLLDPQDKTVRALLDSGYDDIDFLIQDQEDVDG